MVETVTQEREREFSFSDREFRFLAELVANCTGIVLAAQKKDMVYSRLVRRLRALNLTSFGAYCECLQGPEGASEIGNLVNAITTNLTHFFREGHHFDHLRDVVLPTLNAKHLKPKRLRIWSAGCSSGMEPYSLAMTVNAHVQELNRWDARILATDIDTNMLNTGTAGEYGIDEWDKIPVAYRSNVQKMPQNAGIRMSDDLKQLIAFKHLNLLDPWPMKGMFDVIFCRNVVIYFNKQTQAKLFSRMADHLHPGGWLYIGHSENLYKVCDRFELVGRSIYRRIS
jgi:chemotaxis protein methyltransferase CheR